MKNTLTIALVLFLSSASMAAIIQVEGYSIDALNMGGTSGIGSAQSGNLATVGLSNQTFDPSTGTIAIQEDIGVVTQAGTAISTGGASGYLQRASARDISRQAAINPQLQGSLTEVDLCQGAMSSDGAAAAVAQAAFSGGTQIIAGPEGVSAQSQSVVGAQYTGVGAGPNSISGAGGTVDICAGGANANL